MAIQPGLESYNGLLYFFCKSAIATVAVGMSFQDLGHQQRRRHRLPCQRNQQHGVEATPNKSTSRSMGRQLAST